MLLIISVWQCPNNMLFFAILGQMCIFGIKI
jgi:hypothetical protein